MSGQSRRKTICSKSDALGGVMVSIGLVAAMIVVSSGSALAQQQKVSIKKTATVAIPKGTTPSGSKQSSKEPRASVKPVRELLHHHPIGNGEREADNPTEEVIVTTPRMTNGDGGSYIPPLVPPPLPAPQIPSPWGPPQDGSGGDQREDPAPGPQACPDCHWSWQVVYDNMSIAPDGCYISKVNPYTGRLEEVAGKVTLSYATTLKYTISPPSADGNHIANCKNRTVPVTGWSSTTIKISTDECGNS